jgi:hypothetical protein
MELLCDVAGKFVIGNGKERDLAAAGDGGGKEQFGLGGEEDKVSVGRRFFKGLEERIAAGGEHFFSIVDDEDFNGGFKGRKACFLDELSHVSNGMLVAFGIRKNEVDIGMFFFVSSHEGLSDLIGKMSFSDAIGAVKKENMREALFFEKPA